ncbi:hypothetical protein AB0120_26765, partial [Klebsiella pneumoniae]
DTGLPDRRGIAVRVNQPDSYAAADKDVVEAALLALSESYNVVRHERAAQGYAVDAVLKAMTTE